MAFHGSVRHTAAQAVIAEWSSNPCKLLLCMSVSLHIKWNEEIWTIFGKITKITCELICEGFRNVPSPEELFLCFLGVGWFVCLFVLCGHCANLKQVKTSFLMGNNVSHKHQRGCLAFLTMGTECSLF